VLAAQLDTKDIEGKQKLVFGSKVAIDAQPIYFTTA